MDEFRIKYNPVFPIIILVCGLFILVTGLAFTSLSILTGGILVVLSIFMLTKPVIVFTADEVQMKNMVGMTVKRYPYLAGDVDIEGRTIRLNGKKIVGGMLVSYEPQDLSDFVRKNAKKN